MVMHLPWAWLLRQFSESYSIVEHYLPTEDQIALIFGVACRNIVLIGNQRNGNKSAGQSHI